MKQLLVAHVKLKMILKLIQKFNSCVNIIFGEIYTKILKLTEK